MIEDQIRQEGSFICRDGNGGNRKSAWKVEKTSGRSLPDESVLVWS